MSSSFYSDRPTDNFLKFVLLALLLSILVHAGLFLWAWKYQPPRFGEHYYDQIVPRKFRVEPVEIDPAAFDREENDVVPETPSGVIPVELPPEQILMENPVPVEPLLQKLDPRELTAAEESPVPPASGLAAGLQALPENNQGQLVAELESMRQQLLESEQTSPARPTLTLPEEMTATPGLGDSTTPGTGGGLRFGTMPGYSELDDLLGRTGPLTQDTAPIFMPGDLLFEYDEAELRDQARDALRKLGTLIQRNPRTRFRIEGHTDSFGPPEYNQGLSERRALAVKVWLVEEMAIEPERIVTRGLGSTRLIAPATETIEGQRLNRRVEIILENIGGTDS